MSWGVTDLSVRYGDHLALDRASIDAEPGTVNAVVGGDGAGKSTLLKVLTGRVAPLSGEVRRPALVRTGVVSEVPGVWHDLTVAEHVAFTADAYGLALGPLRPRVEALLERAGLAAARDRTGGALSGGMRQKLAVILALLHEPDLLVLDEPTTGVDVVSRTELWRLIGDAAAEGTAVLLATTYLDEAERAGDVLVLDNGRSLLRGAPADLAAGRTLEAVVIERQREAAA